MTGHISTEKQTRDLKLIPIYDLDEQEREKIHRKIRRTVRKFVRLNRQIDFGRVPPRYRLELGERLAEFGDVVKAFRLDVWMCYGDWLADFDCASMNMTAFLEMLLRDSAVVNENDSNGKEVI